MRTWIAICIEAATVWSYLKQIGRKGSKLCQKRFMQICPILSPNYLFNMPTQSHGGRERPTGRGNLLMNRASEGGGEVSWSLPGPEIWQLWEILQFSDKKGTRRCDSRRRTHQTWDLSKNLHDQIFGPKTLHTKNASLAAIFTKKKQRKCIYISYVSSY